MLVIFSGKWRCFSRIMRPHPLVESLFDNLFHCQKGTGANRYFRLFLLNIELFQKLGMCFYHS